jgi:dihydroorotate dehydrogenase
MLYQLAKPILFQLDAEKAHYLAMNSFQLLHRLPGGAAWAKMLYGVPKHLKRPLQCMGLSFEHPVGLAAGFDKDARWIDELSNLGFAFIEVGTLTPKAQAGNPKPRLFRLKKDKALINRMGFNNGGLDAALERLKNRKSSTPIGANIGKNKITPNEEAEQDYLKGFEALYEQADYFVINVSSPNTPGLRALQDEEPLRRLLGSLQEANQKKSKPKPMLLKIAPDMNLDQLDQVTGLVQEAKLEGLVCTNTTITREDLQASDEKITAIGAGGLSGDPVRKRSTEFIRRARQIAGEDFTIIGVGGIRTAEHAAEKLEAGANLVQIYTGFVYEGPAAVKNILRGL